jgi:hypothetical protein
VFLTYGADGVSPGDRTTHHVDGYETLALDQLVVRLVSDELAFQGPGPITLPALPGGSPRPRPAATGQQAPPTTVTQVPATASRPDPKASTGLLDISAPKRTATTKKAKRTVRTTKRAVRTTKPTTKRTSKPAR